MVSNVYRFSRLIGVFLVGALAVGSGLVACDVVGSGVAPDGIEVGVIGPNRTISQPRSIYTCIPAKLSAIMHFTNGSQVDFSSRLTWTSSNPSVATVVSSDGERTVADAGVVTPLSTGTTTITASFDRLHDSAQVTVVDLTTADLKIEKLDNSVLTAVNSTNGFTVAPHSLQRLVLAADESGVMRNISSVAEWSITDSSGAAVPNDGTGALSGSLVSGQTAFVIRAVKPIAKGSTGNYQLQAMVGMHNGQSFCGTPLTIQVPLQVQRVTALTLAPQHPVSQADADSNPVSDADLGYVDTSGNPLPLIRGNAEALSLTAQFANGQTQDVGVTPDVRDTPNGVLNPVVVFTSSDADVATTGLVIPHQGPVGNSADVLSTLESTKAGTTQVSATYCNGDPVDPNACVAADGTTPATPSDSDAVIPSNALNFTTLDGTLTALKLIPPSATLQATSDLDFFHFYAIGKFTTANGPVMQDVSRFTQWQSLDANGNPSTAVGIALAPAVDAGLVGPAGISTDATTATIKASIVPSPMQCAGVGAGSGSGAPVATKCQAITALSSATVTVKKAPDGPPTTPASSSSAP